MTCTVLAPVSIHIPRAVVIGVACWKGGRGGYWLQIQRLWVNILINRISKLYVFRPSLEKILGLSKESRHFLIRLLNSHCRIKRENFIQSVRDYYCLPHRKFPCTPPIVVACISQRRQFFRLGLSEDTTRIVFNVFDLNTFLTCKIGKSHSVYNSYICCYSDFHVRVSEARL